VTAKIEEVRAEYPWLSLDKTSLLQQPSGEVHWWTFGGGVANTLLSHHLVTGQNVKVDNLCFRFPTSMKLAEAEKLIGTRLNDEIRPIPDEAAVENLKFSECLPSQVAGEVLAARFNDPEAIAVLRKEPLRVVIDG
jgi:ATP-dependent Lhr-like helicase